MSPYRLLIFALAAAVSAFASGCAKEGCLDPVDGCVVPSPCAGLEFPACPAADAPLVVKFVESEAEVPGGIAALGAVGDILLSNGHATAIIDALDHPHYISPTGGNLLDLSNVGADNDSLRHIEGVVGVLPDEALAFDQVELITEPGLVAAQFRGTLYSRPDVPVAVRYEMRACDPGVRVRTEIVNLESDPASWTAGDGFYWGGRENVGFSPVAGGGYEHPSFGLSTIPDALREMPYMVAGSHTEPAATYFAVSCSADAPNLTGFQSEDITLMGSAFTLVPSRDFLVHERFIGVTEGPDLAPATDLALMVRGLETATLSGTVALGADDGTSLPDGLRAVVHVIEGTPATPAEERIPWTQTRPADDGSWSVSVPTGADYIVEVEVYGIRTEPVAVRVDGGSATAPAITLPPVGLLTLDATIDGVADHTLAMVHPADDATRAAVAAQLHGSVFHECAPLLGPPHGGSPACNRVLIVEGAPVTVPILPGNYDVFAAAGPFSTLAAVRNITIGAGEEATASLAIETLDLTPDGALSADFHVHGGASFDASIPDFDRVRAFLASRIEVIAATDHDAVWDYAAEMTAAGAYDRMELMVGMETTGHILFDLYDEAEFPQVIGHWNFWPFTFDPTLPYNGGPWDEQAAPGLLFTRAQEAGWPADTGVIQLNHPMSGFDFGRDTGWAAAMAMDRTVNLADVEGPPIGLFDEVPEGANFSNADYHVQEVMNGTDNEYLVRYRAYWHYLLDQGVVRAGTANSDSHSLGGNVLGTPRTLVYSDDEVGDFDETRFNAAVRAGRMTGTNGPVVEVRTTDDQGNPRGPSTDAFAPAVDAQLEIVVSAAPWVPVTEVRVVVNSEVVRSFTTELSTPGDPFGSDGLERLNTSIPLADLLPTNGDAWISVEAGVPLAVNADLTCDGFPDTGDNNGDGTIDWRDVEGLEEDPGEPCLSDSGPLAEPAASTDRTSADYLFRAVVPNGYANSFTNPLLIDRGGDGFDGAIR